MPHSPLLRSAAADELIGLFERWFNLHSSPSATGAREPNQTAIAPLEFTGHDGRIWAYTRRTGWLVRAPDEAPSEQVRTESAAYRRVLREQEEESPWLPLLDEPRPPGRLLYYDEMPDPGDPGERMAYLQNLGRISRARGWVVEESTFTEEERAALRMDTRVAGALEALETADLGASTYGDREATEDIVAASTVPASPTFIHSWAGREWRPWRRNPNLGWQAAADELQDLAEQVRESRRFSAAYPVTEAVYTDSSEDEEEEARARERAPLTPLELEQFRMVMEQEQQEMDATNITDVSYQRGIEVNVDPVTRQVTAPIFSPDAPPTQVELFNDGNVRVVRMDNALTDFTNVWQVRTTVSDMARGLRNGRLQSADFFELHPDEMHHVPADSTRARHTDEIDSRS